MDVDVLVHRKLRHSVVRINFPEGFATGVFIYPGAILTCAHVIQHEITSILYDDIEYPIKEIEHFDSSSISDLAIVHINFDDHPCVCLDSSEESVMIGDRFLAFGFTARCPEGEDITVEYEGTAPFGGKNTFLKIKQGQVIPGYSGSPLLNLRTGYVCGIIKRSWDTSSDLGGIAISSDIILRELPKLRQLHFDYHELDKLTNREKRILKLLRKACNEKQPEEKKSLLEQLIPKLQLRNIEDILLKGIWYFEVARKLGNIDPKTTYEIVHLFSKYLNAKDTNDFFWNLESSWVNQHAAETICVVINKPKKQRAISINSRISFISKCYVEKASSNNPDGWKLVEISNIHGENQLDGLINEIKEALTKKFQGDFLEIVPNDFLEECLEEFEQDKLPIFVSMPGYIFDDILNSVRDNFPSLTLFFLDERIPKNGYIQIDNQRMIKLIDHHINFLEPPLGEKEDTVAHAKLFRAKGLIGNT